MIKFTVCQAVSVKYSVKYHIDIISNRNCNSLIVLYGMVQVFFVNVTG